MLLTFIMFWAFGHVTIHEDNLWARGSETAVLVVVLIIGLHAFRRAYKGG